MRCRNRLWGIAYVFLVFLLPFRANSDPVVFHYYYSPGCSQCETFLGSEIPRMEEELGIDISIERKDLLDPVIFSEFQDTLRTLDAEVTKFPVIILDTIVLRGDREIRDHLGRLVEVVARGEELPSRISRKGSGKDMLLVPVILAGLLDGINPCAFTTLIFLIAALTVAGRAPKEILTIGLCFTASVFVTYVLIGVGLLEALRLASSTPLIGKILKWVLFVVLTTFAAISLYDWTLIRRRQPTKILLQLPTAMKRRIHASVRTHSRSAALIGSSLVMGFLVSTFELACTGQIYFPTVAYLVKTEGGARNYLFLGLYNIGFILPLVVVFVLVYSGVSSQKITKIFKRNMAGVKLCTAVLFAGLAVLTVLT